MVDRTPQNGRKAGLSQSRFQQGLWPESKSAKTVGARQVQAARHHLPSKMNRSGRSQLFPNNVRRPSSPQPSPAMSGSLEAPGHLGISRKNPSPIVIFPRLARITV